MNVPCPGLLETILKVPWHRFLGVRVEETRRGYARLRLPYRPEFAGNVPRGALHGGVLAALADVCAIATLWTFCSPADRSSTVDLKVDYLRPAPLRDMLAEGEIRMLGNRLGNVAIYIRAADAPERTVAEARAVCYRIRGGAADTAVAYTASAETVSV
ncbi:MAG: PaaI family thioesterase [Desulfovibrionaceae bacterium]|nr:PaaI family thioesterase [Desulfovibrionaceae bacterium]